MHIFGIFLFCLFFIICSANMMYMPAIEKNVFKYNMVIICQDIQRILVRLALS